MKYFKNLIAISLALVILLTPFTNSYSKDFDQEINDLSSPTSVSKFFREYRYYSIDENIRDYIIFDKRDGEYHYSGRLYKGFITNRYSNGVLVGYKVEYKGYIPGYPANIVSNIIFDK